VAEVELRNGLHNATHKNMYGDSKLHSDGADGTNDLEIVAHSLVRIESLDVGAWFPAEGTECG